MRNHDEIPAEVLDSAIANAVSDLDQWRQRSKEHLQCPSCEYTGPDSDFEWRWDSLSDLDGRKCGEVCGDEATCPDCGKLVEPKPVRICRQCDELMEDLNHVCEA